MKAIRDVSAIVFLLLFNFSAARAQDWIRADLPQAEWTSAACSADGNVLIAADKSSVYVSTNGGSAWQSNNIPGNLAYASADGSKLAVLSSGNAYVSTNFGVTWNTNALFFPSGLWLTSIGGSADGKRIVATDITGARWTSGNLGRNWFPATTAPAEKLIASADGTKWIAYKMRAPSIYTSTNSSSSWQSSSSPANEILSVAASVNWTTWVVGAKNRPVLISTNSGRNWALTMTPVTNWCSVACSADGSVMIAVAQGADSGGNSDGPPGPVYTSFDGGSTWALNDFTNQFWSREVISDHNVVCSADGGLMMAVSESGNSGAGGFVYLRRATMAPKLAAVKTNANLKISWTVPSTNFILEQTADLSSSSWSTVTDQAALNFTNLQNEITITMTNAGYYRLRTP